MSAIHVVPSGDLVEHETDVDTDDCACGPSTTAVPRLDGGTAWLIVHHSLDGREALE